MADKLRKEDSLPLDMLPSLVHEKILQFLPVHQLLNLRYVSGFTKRWVSNLMPARWDACRVRIEDDDERNFAAASQLELKFRQIYVDNGSSKAEIYTSPGVSAFIRDYAPVVQKLQVYRMAAEMDLNELLFFESLVNMEELKIETVEGSHSKTQPIRFPATFRNLKVLKVGLLDYKHHEATNYKYLWELLKACPQLEYLKIPFVKGMDEGLVAYLKTQIESGGITLRTLDLKCLDGYAARAPLRLPSFLAMIYQCESPLELRQLQRVDLEGLLDSVPINRRSWLNSRVISMQNFPPVAHQSELINLQKLSLEYSSSSYFNSFPHERLRELTAEWPQLRSISISFDDGSLRFSSEMLTHFLFKAKLRPSVEKVQIAYLHPVTGDVELINLISPKLLGKNFTNLKVLEVIRWNLKNVQFLKLWEGLPQLESLKIVAYLKKLSLEILDEMPLLTDRAFRDVFSKMPLRELHLHSEEPLTKVTGTGISALLDGVFATTIEKFLFRYWSLGSMSPSKFQDLGKKFGPK